jgi:hypothetical protein
MNEKIIHATREAVPDPSCRTCAERQAQQQSDDDQPVTVRMLSEALSLAADETFALLRADFEAVNKLLAVENAFIRGQLEGLRRDLIEQNTADREVIADLRSSFTVKARRDVH